MLFQFIPGIDDNLKVSLYFIYLFFVLGCGLVGLDIFSEVVFLFEYFRFDGFTVMFLELLTFFVNCV